MACYKITAPAGGATVKSGVPFTVTFEAPCDDNALAVNATVIGFPLALVSVGGITKTTNPPTVCVGDCVYTVTITITLPCPCPAQQVKITLSSGGVPQDSVTVTVQC